ncbi:hypothetical protein RJD40_10650 [Vibrio scophthalmi]|uniref:hypothetical protein n=1 Tax=Vibrio scophthalmi TaxID=45658 RepID=UPI003AAE4014
MSLKDEVAFYRACGTPKISGHKFDGSFATSEAFLNSFRQVIQSDNSNQAHQFVREAEYNDDNVLTNLQLLEGLGYSDSVTVSCRIAQKSASRFYASLSDFLAKCSLLKENNELPEAFYLIEEDYYYPDDSDKEVIHNQIESLKCICSLIDSLKSVAHYHDKTSNGNNSKLIFIANKDSEESRSDSVIIEMQLSKELLGGSIEDLDMLTTLVNTSANNDIHYQARTNIFLSSLHEFLGGLQPLKAFEKLVKQWTLFIQLFNNNYNIYLSGFAFHKIKKEIANDELTISGEISKVTRELIGKLFSIPVSMSVLIAMSHSQSLLVNSVLVLGLLLVTILLVGIVVNQKQQLISVIHSRDVMKSSYGGDQHQYPEELSKHIEDMNTNIENEISSARKWLLFCRLVVWLPLILATLYYLIIYR